LSAFLWFARKKFYFRRVSMAHCVFMHKADSIYDDTPAGIPGTRIPGTLY